MASNEQELELQLADAMADCYADPYKFVMFAYPWGEPGTPLADWDGPDEWQKAVLDEIGFNIRWNKFDGKNPVAAIRKTVGSGHGIGKSALVAWIVDFIMSTRPYAMGTITANTSSQLESKTWAQIAKWTSLCITSHWFTITSGRGNMKMKHKKFPESWFCTAQTCKEENSEAFAGQDAANSTPFYIFDEASAVPNEIWEVAEGGLTDGEPMFFAFGNPTRRHGKFRDITYGKDRHRWSHTVINSQDCKLTNKKQIQEWIDDYGWDSDFVRVRVRGLPPNSADSQYIGLDLTQAARIRDIHNLISDPLIIGIDLARGGADSNVIQFRKGNDARTMPRIIIPGRETADSMVMVRKIAEVIDKGYRGAKPDAVFLDGTGLGGPIADFVKNLGYDVHEVQFGAGAPNPKFANMRSYMYGEMKEWLKKGGAIDDSDRLEEDLTSPEAYENNRDQVVLESKKDMKKRGLPSPDYSDALGLTFASPVAIKRYGLSGGGGQHHHEYDPINNPVD